MTHPLQTSTVILLFTFHDDLESQEHGVIARHISSASSDDSPRFNLKDKAMLIKPKRIMAVAPFFLWRTIPQEALGRLRSSMCSM
jgi:hypothetical protein